MALLTSIWIFPGRIFAVLVATKQAGTAAETACREATQERIEYAEFSRGRPGETALATSI